MCAAVKDVTIIACLRLPSQATCPPSFSGSAWIPAKEAEVCVYCQDSKGLQFYGRFYHLVGRMHEQPTSLSFFPVTEQFWVSFTERADLVPKDFPRPTLQMEIQAALPWVLPQPSSYERTATPLRVPLGLVRAEHGRITERGRGVLSQDEGEQPKRENR
jgi:hypothetical protein